MRITVLSESTIYMPIKRKKCSYIYTSMKPSNTSYIFPTHYLQSLTRSIIFGWLTLMSLALACKDPSMPAQAEILITGGMIYHKNQLIENDILISGEKISWVGPVDTSKVRIEKVINAQGMLVTPGFIDAHAHGNPLNTPEFENFLNMGVTTIVLGQDGFSQDQGEFQNWADRVDSIKPAVNIVPFVGHSSLRAQSKIGFDENPSFSDLQRMDSLLSNAMEAGYFGLSTGLEYLPGGKAKANELELLAKTVGRYDGLMMSHVRNEDDDQIEKSFAELFNLAKFCRVHVAHIKVVYGKGTDRAEAILDYINDYRAKSAFEITSDFYPYNASYTGIGILFPSWAKPPNDYQSVLNSRGGELLEYLRNRVTKRNGPQATLMGTQPYSGLTLEAIAIREKKPFEELLAYDIGPSGASAAYFIMDSALQNRLVQDEYVMIGSDGSPTMRHPRGYGSFAKVIQEYVLKENLFSMEEALRKMTALPANTLRLEDRGAIAVGSFADLVVFDPKNIRANATFDQPHKLSSGFEYVLVNGEVVISKGKNTSNRPGRTLKKPLKTDNGS